MNKEDAEYNKKMREGRENRKFRETQLIIKAYVLMKQPKEISRVQHRKQLSTM